MRRQDVVARYVEVRDTADEIPASFPILEQSVGSLRGRHFLAAFDPEAGWYRACVEAVEHCSEAERALPRMTVPGGDYLRLRLRGEPPSLYEAILPAALRLDAMEERDASRPCLELYRRETEVDVLMPVR